MYLVLYTDMDIEHQEQAYMKYLIDDLEEYAQSDYYPFHMPGHKRKSLAFPNPYEIDITEIDGFDNLHHATGIIKEAEVRGAELYHSKRCFFLVNGSTCGLLAAISAATRRGDLSLIHISEPTRRTPISYAVFCLKKKKASICLPVSYTHTRNDKR